MPALRPAKISVPGDSSIEAGKEARSNDRGETTPAALSSSCAPGECGVILCELWPFLAGVAEPIVTEDEKGSSTITLMPEAPVGGRRGELPHGCASDSVMPKSISISLADVLEGGEEGQKSWGCASAGGDGGGVRRW